MLDLIFAYSFSSRVEKYYENNIEEMVNASLNGFSLSPNILYYLFEYDRECTKEESAYIVYFICTEFPNVILREYGAQGGHIAYNLDLIKPNPENDISEEWYDKLQETIYNIITKKLKL